MKIFPLFPTHILVVILIALGSVVIGFRYESIKHGRVDECGLKCVEGRSIIKDALACQSCCGNTKYNANVGVCGESIRGDWTCLCSTLYRVTSKTNLVSSCTSHCQNQEVHQAYRNANCDNCCTDLPKAPDQKADGKCGRGTFGVGRFGCYCTVKTMVRTDSKKKDNGVTKVVTRRRSRNTSTRRRRLY